jgi:hypothetical protein
MDMASKSPQEIAFKEGSQAHIFELASNINRHGQGAEVKVESFASLGLQPFGNGSGWARDDGPLGKKYKILRKKDSAGRIISVTATGWAEPSFNGGIAPEVYEYYKDAKCRVLSTGRNIEMDHKDGRKHSFMPVDSCEEFQPLSKAVNDAKRTHCKKCKQTNQRFDATVLGYSASVSDGTINYRGTCVGCYWHDPYAFNKKMTGQ